MPRSQTAPDIGAFEDDTILISLTAPHCSDIGGTGTLTVSRSSSIGPCRSR